MRVLIADDDGTTRLLLKATATKLGHECLVAEDGLAAWDLLTTGGVDVLLSDWMMPGMDGPELCRRVRTELNGHYVYVALITALDNPEQVLEGMKAGADDYLIKPVDPFAVQTRLIAAERVTDLHRQVTDFRKKLELANLELLERSLTDGLTGLGNRRSMEEELERTHARALRTSGSYALILLDIDHFKLFNDHYGHQKGDEVLRTVAQSFAASIRAGERCFRYGGEEFLVLLPQGTADDAAVLGQRIQDAVARLAIPHESRPSSPPLVTVSGGISAWSPGSARSMSETLRQADIALFQAKADGRNCLRGAVGKRDIELAPTLS